MIQLTPQSRIFVATQPVDFRTGIDGLAAVCRQALGDNPLEGAVYVFRNRAGTALKLLTLQRHLISSILLVLEFVAFFYLGSPLALLDCPETYVSRSVRA